MDSIKFIYFDVGGVILNTDRAYKNIGEISGKSVDEINGVFEKYAALGRKDTEEILEDYKRELNVSFGTYEDFVKIHTAAFTPIKETHGLMRKLVKSLPLGLFSNTEPLILETCIKHGSIPDISYKTILASCYVGYKKPQEEIYLIGQKRTGVDAKNILLIDDKKENVDAAKILGWQGFQFNPRDPEISCGYIENYLK
jgi:putative hydrolase of the HAD superfamily